MMNQHHEPDISRKKQTYFLSVEFIVTMVIQTGIFLVLGTTVVNRVEARVAALESQQVTDARIARLEARVETMIENQGEFKDAIKEVQVELRAARAARAVK
jgi:hypothetical protein